MISQSTSARRRIAYLDSLRGLAAVAVVIFHFFGAYGHPPALPDWVFHTPLVFFQDGFAAVSLFFVLSGLVLSLKPIEQGEGYSLKKTLPIFLFHRVTRIFPPFLFWLLVSGVCLKYFYHAVVTLPPQSSWFNDFWAENLSWRDILRQGFLFSAAPMKHLIPQDWTLTYEINISLFMPLYSLLAVLGSGPLFFYMLLRGIKNHFLLAFFWGILISKNFSKIQERYRTLKTPLKIVLFGLALICYTFRGVHPAIIPEIIDRHVGEVTIWLVNGVGSALLIIIAIGSARVQRVLELKLLLYLGRISYSVYLLHFAVLKMLSPAVMVKLNAMNVTSVNTLEFVALTATLTMTVLLADLSYRLIEMPSMALGRWFSLRNQ